MYISPVKGVPFEFPKCQKEWQEHRHRSWSQTIQKIHAIALFLCPANKFTQTNIKYSCQLTHILIYKYVYTNSRAYGNVYTAWEYLSHWKSMRIHNNLCFQARYTFICTHQDKNMNERILFITDAKNTDTSKSDLVVMPKCAHILRRNTRTHAHQCLHCWVGPRHAPTILRSGHHP